MRKYLPAKRAMLTFYVLLCIVGAALNYIIYRYVTFIPEEYLKIVSMIMWSIVILTAAVIVPHYFICAKVVLTGSEIAAAGGFVNTRSDYMPVSSVKSVSVLVTPLGVLTGFNFVMINALGARLVLSFLKKSDALDIAARINGMISSAEEVTR
ncbi:hypothetical protein SAMN02910447_00954 [Ruminococcus sp. YE71]|uniref:hypothetical protein n=1 Tax=unclassified Ruminococcus TaxID=2608920 RepID=UPI0008862752|nr:MULTISPECIES: hypothetical protein [unclassified Ruminococcus]SDA15568.1 hypothetical protein SAMN02910446_00953 [Ruminococcus sp. YE78]SFW22794.1 hypothetical protein SAMN02910447_00954 [Ruminococcus sp. YE71]